MNRSKLMFGSAIALMVLSGCGGGGNTSMEPIDPEDTLLECSVSQVAKTIDSATGRVECNDGDTITEAYVQIQGNDSTRQLITLNDGTTGFVQDVTFNGLNPSTVYTIEAVVTHVNGADDSLMDTSFDAQLTTDTPDPIDSPSSISAPVLESKTDTSINTSPGIVTDPDGVRGITVNTFQDSTCSESNLIGDSQDGDFSGLADDTDYCFQTTAEVKNGVTGDWERITSSNLVVKTDATPTDAPSSITAPTLDSKTETSINTTPGPVTDPDGVRDVTVKAYQDDTCTEANLVGDSQSGDFSGLADDTQYCFQTTAEVKNGATGEWNRITSEKLIVRTDATPEPNNPPEWTQTEYSGEYIIDNTNDVQVILVITDDMVSDIDKDSLSFKYEGIVSIPDPIDKDIWNNVNFEFQGNKVIVSGLLTSDPNATGDVVIKISASDGKVKSYTKVRVPFYNF